MKSVGDMTDLEKWSVFLHFADSPFYRETVNKVIESKEVLQVAGELLMSISQDERERAVFRSRRMYQTDMASNMATARDNGIAEGIGIGRAERDIAIARNALGMKMPIDDIIALTGWTREEIERLLV